MSELKEYIVILNDRDDLDDFYDDMETPGGSLYIPQRAVDLAYRRPMSRSTHYWLTDEEADQIRQDPRVMEVHQTYQDLGARVTPLDTQTSSNWNKSGTNNANDVNWFLLRGYERINGRSNWGSDGTLSQTGTVTLTNIGRNVDVVIFDGHLVAGHPEFAVNPDGTGGSRVVQFNWFQYNPQVRGISSGTYVYDFIGNTADINHGNNVGAIAAGSTCGWARGANIYNYWAYSGSANSYANYLYDVFNYIRVWHNAKTINPATNVKNPTIVNMSVGLSTSVDLTGATQIIYQGVTYNKPGGGWTSTDRANFGLVAGASPVAQFYIRDGSIEQDLFDCYRDGIILCGAAGNLYMYNDRIGGTNYDNRIIASGTYYYARGNAFAAGTGTINVSAIDATVVEQKVNFSNAGPRTDIFSAGTNIMGAYYSGGVTDPRNVSYQKGKMSGTSQATPQVTGLLACALETYPNLKPDEALNYIQTYGGQNQLTGGGAFSTTYGSTDYLSYNKLYGGPNYYAAYKQERPEQDQSFPKKDFRFRPTTGRLYPRPKLRRAG